MKEKGYGFGAQFLKMDKPSYTIPARYYKDGYDALVKYSETKIRRLRLWILACLISIVLPPLPLETSINDLLRD